MNHSDGIPDPIRAIQYDTRGFFNQVVDRYYEFPGVDRSTLKTISTQSIDDNQVRLDEFETRGI